MGKIKDQRNHAKGRALERYNIELSNDEYKGLCKRIQESDNVELVERQSNTRSVYFIDYKGKELKVVYDKRTSQIATFLPKPDDEIEQMIANTLY